MENSPVNPCSLVKKSDAKSPGPRQIFFENPRDIGGGGGEGIVTEKYVENVTYETRA